MSTPCHAASSSLLKSSANRLSSSAIKIFLILLASLLLASENSRYFLFITDDPFYLRYEPTRGKRLVNEHKRPGLYRLGQAVVLHGAGERDYRHSGPDLLQYPDGVYAVEVGHDHIK